MTDSVLAVRATPASDVISLPPSSSPQQLRLSPLHSSRVDTSLEPPTSCQDSEQEKFKNSWLMRLFESTFFDMSIALGYLYNSKSPHVQSYLCSRLYHLPASQVDFYLPQLLNLYLQVDELSDPLERYFTHNCERSILFSLKLAWLLHAFTRATWITTKLQARGSHLMLLILSEQIFRRNGFRAEAKEQLSHISVVKPLTELVMKNPQLDFRVSHASSHHRRSQSVDLKFGLVFDNGCQCLVPRDALLPDQPRCLCQSPQLSAQNSFLLSLCCLSRRLVAVSGREGRTQQLHVGLTQINLNLPARVCVPLQLRSASTHQVLRIPAGEAVLLNSRNRAPYLLFLEVSECESTFYSPLPSPFSKSACSSPKQTSFPDASPRFPPDLIPASMRRNPSYQTISPSCSSPPPHAAPAEIRFQPSDIRGRLAKESSLDRTPFSSPCLDRSAVTMRERLQQKEARIRANSPYSHLPSWRLVGVIVKTDDDFRQELLAVQLLQQFLEVFRMEALSLWVYPYSVLVVSNTAGLIEPIQDALSLHQIKSQISGSLLDYFRAQFGPEQSPRFLEAQREFAKSCAGYCLFSYFVQLKDRHNGNILLDSDGHLIHIDFGFMLSISPGSNLGFERSPFKLNQEFLEVMGGVQGESFAYFKQLMLRGFLAARKHMERIVLLVEILQTGCQLPCFAEGSATVRCMKERFHMGLTEDSLTSLVETMIDRSITSWTTKLYDTYQYYISGIL